MIIKVKVGSVNPCTITALQGAVRKFYGGKNVPRAILHLTMCSKSGYSNKKLRKNRKSELWNLENASINCGSCLKLDLRAYVCFQKIYSMPKSVSASRKNKFLVEIAFRSYYKQWKRFYRFSSLGKKARQLKVICTLKVDLSKNPNYLRYTGV